MSEREILFRGKRVDNGEWIEGWFLPGNERRTLHPCIFVYLPETQNFECFDIDIDTLGEYTGLTDKNGTRIFEHDIISPGGETRLLVCWYDYGWHAKTKYGYEGLERDWVNEQHFKVIGNIHDNPDLLK